MRTALFTLFHLALLLGAALPSSAQQNVYGCPGQPRNAIFYTRIDSLPVLPQSTTYTTTMGTASLSWDTSWAVTPTDSTAPAITANFAYTPGYNGLWRYPLYYVTERQGGALTGNNGADHHTIVVETDTCTVWETYHAYVNPKDGSIETGNVCNGKACNAQSGFKYNGTSFALPSQGTTDAAGLPLLPLLWRGHEILDGKLYHAVRFTMSKYAIQAGHPQWPANGGSGAGGTNAPPYGQRFRLKAATTFNLSGLSAQQQIYAQTMITALQRYGLVLADVGGTFNATVDNDAQLDPDIMTALATVGSQVKPALLEAVDQSSLKPVVPSYQAANSLPVTPFTLVGTAFKTFLSIQAGMSYQLAGWANGPTNNRAVTWSVASGEIGTITSNGLYTPPASVTGLVQGVLKATAVADPNATSTVYVRVLPTGPIRIAAGIQTGTITDHFGHTWLPNIFFRGGNTIYRGGDYPNWPTPSNAVQAGEMAIYQGYAYTYGNDQVMRLAVPNGTYSIRMMFGQAYAGKAVASCSPFPAIWHSNVSIEVQNAIAVRDFDLGASTNHACAVPVDVNVTGVVTNNVLEVALRNTLPDGSARNTAPMFSGVEIIRTK